jgi:competence protein ComEA
VYQLSPGSRANDAIRAAGGARSDAYLDAINLAARLEDGVQLYVPTRREQPAGGAAESTAFLKTGASNPASAQVRSAGSSSRSTKLGRPGEGTVNINTAGAEELQRLPGIGPSYAARIIQFRRENGPFTSPEQLMDVSGIGEKKYEKMKPFVRLR